MDNGVKIIASGYISVYERDGAYQLYINEVEIEGIGNLYIEFNKLKEKLKKEGLFDTKYKKEIPKMPKAIGIVTSPTGAVIRDIINVTKRRFPKIDIKLYPVNVQGQKSAKDICEGIEFFNKMENVDTIIVGRGGGSLEELWSFNEEIVAREVFKSKIPIISAVGHETDFTICDFVSDMRAPTPSAAAEIATPDLSQIYYRLDNIRNRMNRSLNNQVILDNEKLMNTFEKINNYMKNYVIKDKVIQLDQIYDKINFRLEQNLETSKEKLSKKAALLHNLSPLATISRGYSIVEKNNKVINSIKEVDINEDINITLKDGSLECNVNKINSKEV
ncbi:Exodeoxyribonuclease 7 large subunit [bioreactor metagenome]|uniref:Exodeoxyribonuclease 7 large subunit n=1 Tax=bioreactor metagenome TaxID=1076179 RepID=A0A645E6T9_9ZZZZ